MAGLVLTGKKCEAGSTIIPFKIESNNANPIPSINKTKNRGEIESNDVRLVFIYFS